MAKVHQAKLDRDQEVVEHGCEEVKINKAQADLADASCAGRAGAAAEAEKPLADKAAQCSVELVGKQVELGGVVKPRHGEGAPGQAGQGPGGRGA